MVFLGSTLSEVAWIISSIEYKLTIPLFEAKNKKNNYM